MLFFILVKREPIAWTLLDVYPVGKTAVSSNAYPRLLMIIAYILWKLQVVRQIKENKDAEK